jgi:GT2 family glycosyltransferase
MTCEDVDLSWRIRLHRYKVVFVPRSIVYHFGSGVRKSFQEAAQSCYYNVRNTFMMLIKNYNMKNLTLAILTYLTIEFAIFVLSLPFTSKRRYNFARIKALLWILLNLKSIWKKRSTVQCMVRRSSDNNIKNIMIKGISPFLAISWNIVYKKFMTYDHFINYQVYMRNKWII